ncbi:MAG: hypothetical protein VX467_06740 [Verrucomicrobiota bacterium]|nr:hypothetical protein [Verrucomicrobiota bacterium]
MTDIPIDTLFIIGLVIASFVGKFFQKKTENGPSANNKGERSSNTDEKAPSLREVIKEAWERANQPEVLQPEFTEADPPVIPMEAGESEFHDDEQHLIEEILPQAVAVKKEKDFPSSASKNKSDASHSWIRQDLFSSSNSLKKAFVLKEILDKPKSLRSFSV